MNDDETNTAQIETSEDISVDPVCGSAVELEVAREHDLMAEFADREYAFCRPECRDRFLARPAAFAVAGRSGP